jgi:hypothetical protein
MAEIGERIEEVQRVRGWYLSSYAQIEYLLGAFVAVSLGMPEYEALGTDVPHQIAKRIERVQKIAASHGPLSNYEFFIEYILKRFSERSEIRNLLAHGYSEYVCTDRDNWVMRFRKWHRERAQPGKILVLQRDFTLEEFKREAREIGVLAKEVVNSLANIEGQFSSQ